MFKLLTGFFICVIVSEVISLDIAVYYETLCPDSVRFISNQFAPNFKSIANYANISFVPYGHATTEFNNETNEWAFECQHGPNECYGNKAHSCALALNTNNDAIEFIICSMASANPSGDEYLEACANNTRISWDDIQECLSIGQGDKLLAENGEETPNSLNFVPTIIYNKEFNQTLQDNSLTGFLQVVCDLLDNNLNIC